MPVTSSLHEKLTVTSGAKVDVNILTIRVHGAGGHTSTFPAHACERTRTIA